MGGEARPKKVRYRWSYMSIFYLLMMDFEAESRRRLMMTGWLDGWHKGKKVVMKGRSSFSLVSKHVYFAFAFILSSFSSLSTKSTSLSRTPLRTRPGKRKKTLSSQGHGIQRIVQVNLNTCTHQSCRHSRKLWCALLSVSEHDLSQSAIGDVCIPWSNSPCTDCITSLDRRA